MKVAWLYSGLCTRTLVFGERGVWETYLGEARRFVRENRGALLRAVRKGWLVRALRAGWLRRRGCRRRGLQRGVCVGDELVLSGTALRFERRPHGCSEVSRILA